MSHAPSPVTSDTFRAELREAGFYGEWKGRFSPSCSLSLWERAGVRASGG